jgi:hypothetical protein
MRGLPGSEVQDARVEKIAATPASVLGHERLVEIYTPASLLMTSAGDLLEIFGDCGNFLAIKKGKADFNVYTLIKPPFRAELRAFAHRVSRTKQSATSSPVAFNEDGKTRHYRMAVHFVGLSGLDNPDLPADLLRSRRGPLRPDQPGRGARTGHQRTHQRTRAGNRPQSREPAIGNRRTGNGQRGIAVAQRRSAGRK